MWEKFFGSVVHPSTHVVVMVAVSPGVADRGFVNGVLLRQRIDGGTVDPGRVRLGWESLP